MNWYPFPYKQPLCPLPCDFQKKQFHKNSSIIEIVTMEGLKTVKVKINIEKRNSGGTRVVFCMGRRHNCPVFCVGRRHNWPWVGSNEGEMAFGETEVRVHKVVLMAQMRLTRSHFQGENLQASYMCHTFCVNPAHLVLDMHEVNQERIHCKVQGFCCGAHHTHCILPCNKLICVVVKKIILF